MSTPLANTKANVSIIIPVFKNLESVKVCIESILWEKTAFQIEILLVENEKSKDLRNWVENHKKGQQIRLISNKWNDSFASSCNFAADTIGCVPGSFLVFMRDTTKVIHGWLEPLVETIERDNKVGIVGPKILYPDWTIQQAGVALVGHDSLSGYHLEGINLLHNKAADTDSALTSKIVQTIGGSVIMVRPEVFAAVGGFDPEYGDDNETVDLCLKAGILGLLSVYRADSVVHHQKVPESPEQAVQVSTKPNRLTEKWRHRAHPDIIRLGNNGARKTLTNKIRPYFMPRMQQVGNTRSPESIPTVSVIVLTWNALEYVMLCAHALLKHTDTRHEIIFVDNGSDTPLIEYLRDLERNYRQVRLICNGENLGFTAGNNIGIAAATGDHICLLNSDTTVTEGWLERLILRLQNDSRVGIVGAVSNNVFGNNRLPSVDYNEITLSGLDLYANNLAVDNAGRTSRDNWISGFCMLVNRRLVEIIGGFDEAFGQSNYADIDYCLRANLAGFRIVVAHDTLVHHFGSRSYLAGGINYERQVTEKFREFKRKWNLPARTKTVSDLDFTKIFANSFVSPLHYFQLPTSSLNQEFPVSNEEIEKWLECGSVRYHACQYEDAAKIFRTILELAPNHNRARNYLNITIRHKTLMDRKMLKLEKIQAV